MFGVLFAAASGLRCVGGQKCEKRDRKPAAGQWVWHGFLLLAEARTPTVPQTTCHDALFGGRRTGTRGQLFLTREARADVDPVRRPLLILTEGSWLEESGVAPAVELQILTRDVARLCTAKEGAGVTELLRGTQPPRGNRLFDFVIGLFERDATAFGA